MLTSKPCRWQMQLHTSGMKRSTVLPQPKGQRQQRRQDYQRGERDENGGQNKPGQEDGQPEDDALVVLGLGYIQA